MTPTARARREPPTPRQARASRQPIETWHSVAYFTEHLTTEDD